MENLPNENDLRDGLISTETWENRLRRIKREARISAGKEERKDLGEVDNPLANPDRESEWTAR